MSLDLRWTYEPDGTVMAPPAPANGTVYVGYNPGVVALDADSGAERRSFDVGDVRVSPVVAGGQLLVGTNLGMDDGTLRAFDPSRGIEHWSHSFDRQPSGLDATADSAVIACDERIRCYATGDGRQRWTYDNRHTGDQYGYFSDVVIAGDTVFATSEDDTVYGLDARTGDERWRCETTGNAGDIAVGDGLLFVGPKGVLGRMGEGTVYALDADTGEVRWQTPVEQGIERPATDEDAVYVTESDRLRALDRETGSEIWRYAEDGSVSTPVVLEDIVYVGDGSGELVGVERFHGDARSSLEVGDDPVRFLTSRGADLYGVTEAGTVVAVGTSHDVEATSGVADRTPESGTAGGDDAGTCPSCDRSLTGDEAFCPGCGADLSSAFACPECGADLDGDEAFCPACGHALAK